MPTRPLAILTLTSVLSIFALASDLAAADAVKLPLDRKESFVKFVGESFLHDFHGEAKEFSGDAELDPNSTPPIQHASLHFAEAKLTTFHEGRDKKMFEWLKVEAHPDATFALERVQLTGGDFKAADAQHVALFAVAGSFNFNAIKQPISGTARGWRDKNRLIITGETTIDTLKFGLPQIREAFMTAGTNVRVSYQLTFVLPPEYAFK
jgi:polyisoprenoid-binding protein YceI